MKTIVILGAAGRAGEACAAAFLSAGWIVRGVARGTKAATLLPGIEPVDADARDRDALIKACRGADIILHALNPRYDEWTTKVLPLAENVIAAAKATGATIMMPGNVYNFGHVLALDMTENTRFQPREDKGQIRVSLEAMLEDAATRDGVQSIVIRAGDFFGGKQSGTWLDQALLRDLKKGKLVWPGRFDVPHAFAYLPDLAAAFVAVAEKRDSLPACSTLHFAGHTVTGNDFLLAVEAASGRTIQKAAMPWRLLTLIGLVNPVIRGAVKMRYLWDVPHSLDDTRLSRLIGTVPHTPLAAALRQAIVDLELA